MLTAWHNQLPGTWDSCVAESPNQVLLDRLDELRKSGAKYDSFSPDKVPEDVTRLIC